MPLLWLDDDDPPLPPSINAILTALLVGIWGGFILYCLVTPF